MNQFKADPARDQIRVPQNGRVPYTMKNDYLFRAVLQTNEAVLKGLICSLLHLDPDTVSSVSIENPIELGKAIDDKDFYLDTKICLNNSVIINLEMQVLNEGDWPERSLSYLCRTFDSLTRGSSYLNVKPAIHIGFLDFNLFKEHPEFYATYRLLNIKDQHLYSDKFQLSVVNLTQTALATEEDKNYQIDYWGLLFKATTWEEIRMLAEQNKAIQEASETIYRLSREEEIRLQCEAREDYYRRQKDVHIHYGNELKKKDEEIQKKDMEINKKDTEIALLRAELNKIKNNELKI